MGWGASCDSDCALVSSSATMRAAARAEGGASEALPTTERARAVASAAPRRAELAWAAATALPRTTEPASSAATRAVPAWVPAIVRPATALPRPRTAARAPSRNRFRHPPRQRPARAQRAGASLFEVRQRPCAGSEQFSFHRARAAAARIADAVRRDEGGAFGHSCDNCGASLCSARAQKSVVSSAFHRRPRPPIAVAEVPIRCEQCSATPRGRDPENRSDHDSTTARHAQSRHIDPGLRCDATAFEVRHEHYFLAAGALAGGALAAGFGLTGTGAAFSFATGFCGALNAASEPIFRMMSSAALGYFTFIFA